MKKIGLTQRVEVMAGYDERRDCLDQRWTELLAGLGCLAIPIPNRTNDPRAFVEELKLDGVILTGGNDLAVSEDAKNIARERDELEMMIINHCAAIRLPLLGVCRGMQSLAVHYGMKLVPQQGHACQAHTIRTSGTLEQFYGSTTQVTCYHGFAVDFSTKPQHLESMAWADDGTLEAIRHLQHHQIGIMWHPERAIPFRDDDRRLLQWTFGEAA